MATTRAPKQWKLTKNESITSFENWKQNLLYILSLDSFWEKKTAANPNRGLVKDGEDVPDAQRKTAAQKNAQLELMLGQIANYCSVISRNSIIKNSTSLIDIWQKIRQHFGFQSTGAHFLDLVDIKLQPDERPEDLFQRLTACIEDNLLTADGGVTHHGRPVGADEDLSPSMENIIVVLWLKLIHPGLPQLVKQKYGTELRNQSVASLKPEISQAIAYLLDELRTIEDTKAMRTASFNPRQRTQGSKWAPKSCILCKSVGRPTYNTHNLANCRYLPESDRRMMTGRSRLVNDDVDVEIEEPLSCPESEDSVLIDQASVLHVDVIQSPFINTFYDYHPVRLTIDTGATTNMIKASFAQTINLPMTHASQRARQADGVTPLDVIGDVHCNLVRDDNTFCLDALVVKQLDVDVLAGNPFLVLNDIATRPAKNQVIIRGAKIYHYGSQRLTNASVRRTQAFVLRSPPLQTTVMPGDFIELKIPDTSDPDSKWALEPRLDSPNNATVKPERAWPLVQEVHSVGHTIRLANTTYEPILLKRNEHLCQIRYIDSVDNTFSPSDAVTELQVLHTSHSTPFSTQVSVDPDECLSQDMRSKFVDLHQQFDEVYDPTVSTYNGASGKLEAVVNMGPTQPPQRKGRLPHYNRTMLTELQSKFDELEHMGVFATPEQVNVSVEYLNLSFLIRKPNGGSRLVTSFGEVGTYSKPQPALMPNVDNVLRDIGRWKFIIKTDLLKAFYQIPLSQSSMKYCGVVTPFRGVRVYTRCAMGMPGSETCLEEFMCRVRGHLIQKGCVAKLADDLICGGNTSEEVLENRRLVLTALHKNNLCLTASKTVICPASTNILGWIWSNGTLKASPPRIAAMSTVSRPTNIQGLRSFVGAHKALSRVLPGYAELLDPFDKAATGKQSKDKIVWTEELINSFQVAQSALAKNKTITIPRPNDRLWIVTDASAKTGGLAATLYICRNNTPLLAGFVNAKLKSHQITWLPCEVEALAISASVKHFAPYITSSSEGTHVLTDSRCNIEK